MTLDTRVELPKNHYRDFMRARRPELFSDTIHFEESDMDRRQFEFHLDSLTSRKQETAFENFARGLAERELCPNLLPQTGPTGGGDSKVDSETYPVASSIATLWYEGDPGRSSSERWAFAFSAKKAWKDKVRDDVKKIVETGRGYTLAYFISNQAIRDKDRSEKEDRLKATFGIEVRILDRTWIIEKVCQHKRWELVADTLQFELQRALKSLPGPVDSGRLQELQILDQKIDAASSAQVTPELVEEGLQAALLARGLDRSRIEVDGRFERAQRLAETAGSANLRHRIWYQRAWTAIWWFNDPAEALKYYDVLAAEVLESEWIWAFERLINLWLALQPGRPADIERESALLQALKRHAGDASKPTSSLFARAQLLLVNLVVGLRSGISLDPIFAQLKLVLDEVRRQVEFPVDPLVQIVRELSDIIGDSPAYEELLDRVIELERERHGDRAEGELRLERGLKKLARQKPYDAINDLSKSQFLLAQEERRGQFISALAGAGLAYEAAGLLYAARANLVLALDRCLYSYFKEGAVDPRALPLARKLAWLELQLGRAPYVLAWIKWLPILATAVSLSDTGRSELANEVEAIDRVLGILMLRTPLKEWQDLTRLPDVLQSHGLEMSRCAALFMLGHEDTVRSEYPVDDTDLEGFFSNWIAAPAADDLPLEPNWHIGTSSMITVVLGCRLEVVARGGLVSSLLGESIIAFLEAFFSTAVQSRSMISPREHLVIEVRSSDRSKAPFTHRIAEDNCGETSIVVTHPVIPTTELFSPDSEEPLFQLFARVFAELQLSMKDGGLEEMFAKHRAQDRAFQAARSIVGVVNILDQMPPGRAADWVSDSTLTVYEVRRDSRWVPSTTPAAEAGPAAEGPLKFSQDEPPEHLFGVDAVKHREMRVLSPINLPLWDRAKWRGVTVGIPPGSEAVPFLGLGFSDIESGRKIFRGWKNRIGDVDQEGWLGITIITGINRTAPLDYRVAISIGEEYFRKRPQAARVFVMTSRMQDMNPQSDANLRLLLGSYQKAGRAFLHPSPISASLALIANEDWDLRIAVMTLNTVAAWEVGPTSPLMISMGGIEDPVIPVGVTNPPIQELIRARRERAKRRAPM